MTPSPSSQVKPAAASDASPAQPNDATAALSAALDPIPPSPGYEVVHFDQLTPKPCPCGAARRAFTHISDFPATVHLTEIHETARRHYHKRLSETYYVLECHENAYMELNDQRIPLTVGSCILIHPGTRHRAVGRMKVLIFVLPKFDESDEWFDEGD